MYEAGTAIDFFDMVGRTEWHQDLQRRLVYWIGIRDTDEALDVGCGAGHFVLRLAQRAQFVTGLDSAPEMIRLAGLHAEDAKTPNAGFVAGSVTSMPFPDARFDLVTCLNLLFMFRNLEQPVKEMLRVLKPAGQLIVLEPGEGMNPWSTQTFCDANHLRDFERESILSYATAAARYGSAKARLRETIGEAGGIVTETAAWMGGLVEVYRIAKRLD